MRQVEREVDCTYKEYGGSESECNTVEDDVPEDGEGKMEVSGEKE